MKNLIFLILNVICLSISAQDFRKEFKEEIEPLNESLEYILARNEYIVYASPNRALYIIKINDEYFEFIYNIENEKFKLQKVSFIKDSKVGKLFDKKSYVRGYIDINSDFYKKGVNDAIGLPTYFSFRLNTGIEYCEYMLAVIIDPVPMDKKVYQYITLRFLGIDND